MSEKPDREGPRSGAGRRAEQEAVVTTIVGGRPPGSGQPVGPIPRGIEILVKKAAVDAEFKALLLERRAEAAGAIDLDLDPAEAMMLRAVPADQLEAIIVRTAVPAEHRRAFLGHAASAMLAALAMTTGVSAAAEQPAPAGIRPAPAPKPSGGSFGNLPDRLPEKNPPKDDPKKPAKDDPTSVEARVVRLVAKRLNLPADKVTPEAALAKDLKAKTKQLSNLRKDLEQEFRIEIPVKTFGKLRTVQQVIDHVERAIKGRPPVVPPKPLPVRGTRPDRPPGGPAPPPAAVGGVRP